MGDVEWKMEQVQFLLHKGFFYPHSKEDLPPVSGLLAGMQYALINLRIGTVSLLFPCCDLETIGPCPVISFLCDIIN
jgi:hypothetical protein